MPLLVHLPVRPRKHRDRLRHACRTAGYALACLIAAMPAARAHGDDERPSPEIIGWGAVCFLLTLGFILIACHRAPYNARPRFQPTRKPRLKSRILKRPSRVCRGRKTKQKDVKVKMYSSRNSRGFTLIELLIVIAIIAILAAILFPVFAQARAEARKAVCMANMKQLITATRMYSDDYDGYFPRIQASDGNGNWTVVSWWAVHFYQEALNPYIKMGRGTSNKLNVWWDPSDPSRNMPYMWGSFINNGLLTCNNTSEVAIDKPAETIYSALRAQSWDVATGTAPLPVPAPPANDPFWTSEYFDFGVDPYEKSDPASLYWWSRGRIFPPCSLFATDPYCADWEPLLDTHRYARQAPYSFMDGHVKTLPFALTYRSTEDNMWDLH